MCGINGIFGLKDNRLAKGVMTQMNDALAHRGPDDEGIYEDTHITMGHRRLSIIDLSTAGKQPMLSYDNKYVIVYNGELYNYQQLKSQLNDYPFTTKTDTEVILAAYIQWSRKCVEKFNGMFAFAIWDVEKKELFIARDRIGIKPLYYFKKDNLFVFSSEVRALLSSRLIPRKVEKESIIDFLRYQTVHAPHTIIKDVYSLLPGHSITLTQNDFSIKKYWNITTNSKTNSNSSYKETCVHIHSLLTASVERRLIADVPFGAFLSGGIDSSAIVGLMSKVSTQTVKTFSVVFDEKEYSESEYSTFIAKKFNTEHHQINLKVKDFINQLPNALKAMDHPSGDGPNTYIVSKATKEAGITMALSGLGGDEVFAGYDIFKRSLSLASNKWISRFPKWIRSFGGEVLKIITPNMASDKIAELLKLNQLDFASTYPFSRQVFLDNYIKELVSSVVLPDNFIATLLHSEQHIANKHLPLLSQVSIAEMNTYMQNVLLRDTDQMSMAHALEVRVPFLDHELVEYVIGVPDKYKNPTTPKKLLTDSLFGLLPDEIIHRKKMGFLFPWNHWLKNELKSFCEQKIYSLAQREYFNQKEVLFLWEQFLKNNPKVPWLKVWLLVVLENWLIENHVD